MAGPRRLPPASDCTGLFHELQRPSVGRLRKKKERFRQSEPRAWGPCVVYAEDKRGMEIPAHRLRVIQDLARVDRAS